MLKLANGFGTMRPGQIRSFSLKWTFLAFLLITIPFFLLNNVQAQFVPDPDGCQVRWQDSGSGVVYVKPGTQATVIFSNLRFFELYFVQVGVGSNVSAEYFFTANEEPERQTITAPSLEGTYDVFGFHNLGSGVGDGTCNGSPLTLVSTNNPPAQAQAVTNCNIAYVLVGGEIYSISPVVPSNTQYELRIRCSGFSGTWSFQVRVGGGPSIPDPPIQATDSLDANFGLFPALSPGNYTVSINQFQFGGGSQNVSCSNCTLTVIDTGLATPTPSPPPGVCQFALLLSGIPPYQGMPYTPIDVQLSNLAYNAIYQITVEKPSGQQPPPTQTAGPVQTSSVTVHFDGTVFNEEGNYIFTAKRLVSGSYSAQDCESYGSKSVSVFIPPGSIASPTPSGSPTPTPKLTPSPPSAVKTGLGTIPTEPGKLASAILAWGTGIVGGIAFLMMLYGGFLILTSGGHPENLALGREVFTAAVIGLLFVLFAIWLLRFLGIGVGLIPGAG